MLGGKERVGDLKKWALSSRADCDFENFSFQLWDNTECKDEAFFTSTIPWNKCTKSGDNYVIMTGASALSAHRYPLLLVTESARACGHE